MKFICCFVVSLLLSSTLLGSAFVIDKIHDCNCFYTLMIRTAIKIYKENKVYITCDDTAAKVSYAHYNEVPFVNVSGNTYLKSKGKYNVYLTLNRNEEKEVVKAYFIIMRNKKKIAHVSLVQV